MDKQRFYGTKEWHKIRQKVLSRDHRTCQSCGTYCPDKGSCHVDHIIPRRRRPDLALDLSNLQVLCSNCHNSFKQRLESQEELNPDRGVDENGCVLAPDSLWSGYTPPRGE